MRIFDRGDHIRVKYLDGTDSEGTFIGDGTEILALETEGGRLGLAIPWGAIKWISWEASDEPE